MTGTESVIRFPRTTAWSPIYREHRSARNPQLPRGGDPCLQAWGGAASFQERKLSKRNRRVSRRGRTNDRKMPTSGRAGPRILSSGLRGRLRRAHARSVGRPVVGLGAASSGPDWRSIRDVLSVARFASALVSKHQSPLVNAYVGSALLQAPPFRAGVVDRRVRSRSVVYLHDDTSVTGTESVIRFPRTTAWSPIYREHRSARNPARQVSGVSFRPSFVLWPSSCFFRKAAGRSSRRWISVSSRDWLCFRPAGPVNPDSTF